MQLHFRQLFILVAAPLLLLWGCHRGIIVEPEVEPVQDNRIIPEHCGIPRVYIETPSEIRSKREWVELSTIRIEAEVEGNTRELYYADSLKIKGRGNTTWSTYPKKPYSLKLKHKADFLGTGKTSRWVLLANWMDRTHLRNDVAFEMARRTSMEWAPSGTFVELYLNSKYQGMYWLGERIHVEGSHFKADYLYSFDITDKTEFDFYTLYGRRGSNEGEIPVELKYPDRDDYTAAAFTQILSQAQSALQEIEKAIYVTGNWSSMLDLDSICDWFLLHEVCNNFEPRHPKSCFFYLRDGKFYAGPVWDFDWGTFTWDNSNHDLNCKRSFYFHQLWSYPAFTNRLKQRWKVLKPIFEGMTEYIDERAALIRGEVEQRDHQYWPCNVNPFSDDGSGMVNGDENLTFDAAVERMKANLLNRIQDVDANIRSLS